MNYSRQLKILKLQLNISQPLKKQLWKRIVKQKILNQAKALTEMKHHKLAERLIGIAQRVKSGDGDNMETYAAQLYFSYSFGDNFTREQENAINAHLNYAYTILRSAVARALVLYGWLPSLGFFHKSEVNPYNLADDFIEPFRPIADMLVWDLWKNGKLNLQLTPIAKQSLIKLLHYQIQFEDQTFTVLAAIDRCIGSLQSALISKNANLLKLPQILPLKEHQYE